MVKLFLDTSKIEEITRWRHLIEGVTTNPSIIAKEGGSLEEICALVSPLPVSVEAGGGLYSEAHKLQDWLGKDGNLVVKIPFLNAKTGRDNLEVISKLVSEDFQINCTAILSAGQYFLASKTGCKFISVFGGRVEDEGGDFQDILEICSWINATATVGSISETIVGSIRTVGNVLDCIRAGVDIITIPPGILEKMAMHRYSLETSKQFEGDYVPVDILKGIDSALEKTGKFPGYGR